MAYPVCLNLSGKTIVIFGGGAVAYRKLTGLLHEQAIVRVVAPEVDPRIVEVARAHENVRVVASAADPEHIENAHLVFAVTDSEMVNDQIAGVCHEKGIFVNNCMDSATSSFSGAAVYTDGDIQIAVNTGGRPGLSKKFLHTLINCLPENRSEWVRFYDTLRAEAKEKYPTSRERQKYIKSKFEAAWNRQKPWNL